MSQNRILGPVLTLVAVAALGGGIWLVNEGQRAEPLTPQPAVAQAPAPPSPAPVVPAAPAFPARADYVGEIPTKTGVIALEISVTGAEATAYACDNASVEVWLRGSATGGKLDLLGKDGGSRLTGGLGADGLAGQLTVGAKSWSFTAARSTDYVN